MTDLTSLVTLGLALFFVWETVLLLPFALPVPLQPLIVVGIGWFLVHFASPTGLLVAAAGGLVILLHHHAGGSSQGEPISFRLPRRSQRGHIPLIP